MNNISYARGIGLIEVVIGVAIITAAVVALTVSYGIFIRSAGAEANALKAEFLLEEGLEAVRSIRDNGWTSISNLSTDTPHGISFTVSQWELGTNVMPIDEVFYRSVVFNEVFRDANDDIASSGTPDPFARKVTVSVSWESRTGTTTSTLETYMADIYINQ